ncbi:hypothetical protein D1871_12000 [Nakamurella silvestris]|nr:hypothetical protein D1871_12000 [Nakamurella silvestris]
MRSALSTIAGRHRADRVDGIPVPTLVTVTRRGFFTSMFVGPRHRANAQTAAPQRARIAHVAA